MDSLSSTATPLDDPTDTALVANGGKLTIRELAIASLRSYEAAREDNRREDERKWQEREAATLVKRCRDHLGLKTAPELFTYMEVEQPGGEEPWIGEYPVVDLDGLRFTVCHDGWEERLGLVRPCPRCETVVVQGFLTLEDLGTLLESPIYHRYCPVLRREARDTAPPKPPTTGERLEALIREIVRDEREGL
jgi:hypothetical protein